ncbi:molybdopterin-dependent oxidoreductase [Amnibacterium endophyticum]|uniref:Molybdopterin-dependent oxidoreductase n=1 Tax=Amnibacterium endophyticum TaxID=2109337 RepID=A0ABW4LIS1_9MICO
MPEPLSRPLAVGGGVAAAVAGLGAGELVAAVFSTAASPLLATGSLLVDAAPPQVKSAVIALFGTGDKPFLVVLLTVLVLLLGAAAGLLQRWRPPLGVVPPGLAAVVAAIAAVTRTDASVADVAPSAVAGVIGAFVVVQLVHPVREPSLARRRLVSGAAVWAGAGVVAGSFGRSIGSRSRDVSATIARLRLPPVTAPAPPAPTSLGVTGAAPLVTDAADFYRIDIALTVPAIEPEGWSLEVAGEVDAPFRIGYDELVAMAGAETAATLVCVSNPVGGDLVGTAVWQGAPLHRLLERARPRQGADMVLSSGADGFSASTPLALLQDPARGALLAVGMNGRPLPQIHGFPARMVVPGLYGYVSATKWTTRLEVTRFDEQQAYWTPRGYAARAPVKLSSRIDVPLGGVDAGVVTVAGVAWAQPVGVARVQLQIDDGPWRDCELSAAWTDDTWRQWRYRWTATPGEHRLRVRATDRSGLVQTAAETGELPDGPTGLHTVRLAVS